MADAALALPEPYAQWLEAMAADPASAGDAPPLDALIGALAESNPHLKAVAHLLTAQRPAEDDEGVIDVEPIEIDPARAARRDALLQHLRDLVDELDVLRSRNAALAAALGACADCWGERPDCHRCRGDGEPGSHRLDLHLFELWVVPAISALRQQRKIRSVPTGGAQP